ncbi:hypothetical protein WKW79_31635 [Variovorax robiniae]|uniref:Uncharacterized protein n=1 Tax=Variovorax robiniae TaxID=1836199 RepID=A0ABU8XH10_9BURK
MKNAYRRSQEFDYPVSVRVIKVSFRRIPIRWIAGHREILNDANTRQLPASPGVTMNHVNGEFVATDIRIC